MNHQSRIGTRCMLPCFVAVLLMLATLALAAPDARQSGGEPDGVVQVAKQGLEVSIPGEGNPTGQAFNGTGRFHGDLTAAPAPGLSGAARASGPATGRRP